jgi:hypothetical protein
MPKVTRSANKLEGEGSYSAARKYDAKLADFQRQADVGKLAREARKALEGPEAATLRRAEQRGKAGPSPAPAARKPARAPRAGRGD